MATCEVCENEYDKAFEVVVAGKHHTFDSFECAIHALAPLCPHCNCRIVGHSLETMGKSIAAFIARVRPARHSEGPRLSLQSRSMVGRRWFRSKPGNCARKRGGRKSASPYCFAWQQLACKLLPMPGLRHVLDPRLTGVTDQNEGQSVLVRVAKLINAGTFARFGGCG
jgi:hypothetical protein